MSGALELLAVVAAAGLVGAGVALVVMRGRAKRAGINLLPLAGDRKPAPGSPADANVRLIAYQHSARADFGMDENLRRSRALYDFLVANEIALPACMQDEASRANVTPFPPRPLA